MPEVALYKNYKCMSPSSSPQRWPGLSISSWTSQQEPFLWPLTGLPLPPRSNYVHSCSPNHTRLSSTTEMVPKSSEWASVSSASLRLYLKWKMKKKWYYIISPLLTFYFYNMFGTVCKHYDIDKLVLEWLVSPSKVRKLKKNNYVNIKALNSLIEVHWLIVDLNT